MRNVITACAVALAGAAQAASDFSYYASPVLAYQCVGYSTGSCTGFETSHPAHTVYHVDIVIDSTTPLTFIVKADVDGTQYRSAPVRARDTGTPFAVFATDGSDTPIKMTVHYAATRHCVGSGSSRHCTDRYLPESGKVQLP